MNKSHLFFIKVYTETTSTIFFPCGGSRAGSILAELNEKTFGQQSELTIVIN